MTKFGAVKVGQSFDCLKKNGKQYAGEIVRVASYPRGTLVTIRWYVESGFHDRSGQWYNGADPVHRSIYLEDCEAWQTEETPLS